MNLKCLLHWLRNAVVIHVQKVYILLFKINAVKPRNPENFFQITQEQAEAYKQDIVNINLTAKEVAEEIAAKKNEEGQKEAEETHKRAIETERQQHNNIIKKERMKSNVLFNGSLKILDEHLNVGSVHLHGA